MAWFGFSFGFSLVKVLVLALLKFGFSFVKVLVLALLKFWI